MSATCYRQAKDLKHSHSGPFSRCGKCGHIICEECIGKQFESRRVFCVECSRPIANVQTNHISMQPRVDSLISGLTKPLWAGDNQIPRWYIRAKQDFTWMNYRDIIRFVFVLSAIVILVITVAILLSLIFGMSFARLMIGLTVTLVLWGILVTYIQYFLRGLPRPVSLTVACIAAVFPALLFLIWFVNLKILDPLFKLLGG